MPTKKVAQKVTNKKDGKKDGKNRKDIMKILHYGMILLHVHDSTCNKK